MKFRRLGLILLFVAQFALFWQFAKREIVWAYPADFDQSAYLAMDYTLYRGVLQEGLLPAITTYLHQAHPTGLMLPLQDTIFHFFVGPGRLTDLLSNLAYFLLLETIFFATARWLSGRDVFGWIGCGLLMMQQTAFLRAGGLFDCRIDFIAYCLYGIFVCLLVRSDGLREKRWLAAAAGCALLMVSFRFVTFAYLVGFCMTLFAAVFGLRLLWRGRRGENLVLTRAMWRTAALGAGFLIAGGTVIASNWHHIHDYYVVGHLTGNEKHIRAREMGVTNLTEHLTYYFSSLLDDHFGRAFNFAWLALAMLGLMSWLLGRRGAVAAPQRQSSLRSYWFVQLLIICASLFAPWFILTLDESKSPLVASVLAPPATLLLISLIAGFERTSLRNKSASAISSAWKSVWWPMATTVVLMLGAFNWLNHLSREGRFSSRKASVDQIAALYDFLGGESTRMGFITPRISADMIYDWLVPNTINVSLYERSGQWLGAQGSLGVGIFAVSHEQVFADLEKTDIALITSFPKVGPYPFYDSIRPLGGEIKAWCETHFLRARTFAIDDGQVIVYLRRDIPVEGLSGGWITPAGIRLRLSREVLAWMRAQGTGTLVMAGNDHPDLLPQAPAAKVQAQKSDGYPIDVLCPAVFTRLEPARYQVRIDLRALLAAVPAGDDAVVALKLDGAYFVPSTFGMSADTRQLVVNGPTDFRFE